MVSNRVTEWPWDTFAALPLSVQLILISSSALCIILLIVLWRIGEIR